MLQYKSTTAPQDNGRMYRKCTQSCFRLHYITAQLPQALQALISDYRNELDHQHDAETKLASLERENSRATSSRRPRIPRSNIQPQLERSGSQATRTRARTTARRRANTAQDVQSSSPASSTIFVQADADEANPFLDIGSALQLESGPSELAGHAHGQSRLSVYGYLSDDEEPSGLTLQLKSVAEAQTLLEGYEVKRLDHIAVFRPHARSWEITVVADLRHEHIFNGTQKFIWARFGVRRLPQTVRIIAPSSRNDLIWPPWMTRSVVRLEGEGNTVRRDRAPSKGKARAPDYIDLTLDSD
ncbi:hypothetical protein PsYK624_071960 [Phanerochaete sordida]|uniref:Uncharacterized protein n=1 Tax=Phanerochaete sordida TaxID=48140 RepID=A0A9P3GBT8_9APHY|nr:hypothetical protein PsYK624_071530 [Phanerochaete sordida]GJE91048.1 hypothetical protein PsYK624_071960 [Phanerochaete sordida]